MSNGTLDQPVNFFINFFQLQDVLNGECKVDWFGWYSTVHAILPMIFVASLVRRKNKCNDLEAIIRFAALLSSF